MTRLIRGYKRKEQGFGEEYTENLADRTRIGEWFLFKKIIPNTLAKCRGLVVDFGCGIGDILARCPPGSIGLEVNQTSVDYCKRGGLDVRLYDPVADDYRLDGIEPGAFQTLLMSHVLEHVPDTANVLRKLLASCHRLGFEHVVIKVPGWFMYKRDATHVTFVDRAWLRDNALLETEHWRARDISYYPINNEWIGRYALVHEMIIVYTR